MSRRVLVCGSRHWTDRQTLFACLDALHQDDPISVIIEGEAPGADTLGREWAESKGIPVEKYPADWVQYGRATGPLRNKQMLTDGKPDLVVACSNDLTKSKGTKNMMEQAKKANVPVIRVMS